MNVQYYYHFSNLIIFLQDYDILLHIYPYSKSPASATQTGIFTQSQQEYEHIQRGLQQQTQIIQDQQGRLL